MVYIRCNISVVNVECLQLNREEKSRTEPLSDGYLPGQRDFPSQTLKFTQAIGKRQWKTQALMEASVTNSRHQTCLRLDCETVSHHRNALQTSLTFSDGCCTILLLNSRNVRSLRLPSVFEDIQRPLKAVGFSA